MVMMYTLKIFGHHLEEINDVVKATVTPELFRKEYAHVFD